MTTHTPFADAMLGRRNKPAQTPAATPRSATKRPAPAGGNAARRRTVAEAVSAERQRFRAIVMHGLKVEAPLLANTLAALTTMSADEAIATLNVCRDDLRDPHGTRGATR